MNNIVNVFLGLMIVYGLGYLLLRLIDGQYHIRKTEAFCLSPIFFFIYILVLYAFQSLGISILSSAKIFWTFNIVIWIPVCFLLFERKPAGSFLARTCQIETPAFRDILFLLGFLSVILFAGFIAWPSPDVFFGLKGDTERHILFINQLLAGFTFTHYPPFGLEQFSDYPCLAHITVGFFVRLFHIGVFDAYSIVHILQAVMLPAGIFLLIHRLTHNLWISLFSMILVAFYGGLYEVSWGDNPAGWFFNTSIQRLLPHHITRNLAFSFEPYFLFLFVSWIDNRLKFYIIMLGLILGITGLTHTYPFIFLFAFLFIYLFVFWKTDVRRAIIGIMLIGISVILIWLVPMAYRLIFFHHIDLSFFPVGFKYLEYRQIILTWDIFLKYYGFVGIMALFSLPFFWKQQNRNFLFILFATSILIAFGAVFKEFLIVETPMDWPSHPMQEKFGTSFYLTCVIFTSILLHSLVAAISGLKRKRLQLSMSMLLFLLITAALYGGSRATYIFKSQMTQMTESGYEIPYDISIVIEKLRGITNTETVFCVPPAMIKSFAPLTGCNTLYSHTSMVFSPERLLASKIMYCDKKQRKYLEKIAACSYSDIFLSLVEYYKINYYIHKTQRKANLPPKLNLKAIDEIHWVDGDIYTIYEIDAPRSLLKLNYPLISSLLGSDEVFNHFVGYHPYFASQWVRPKLFSLGAKQINGLASDGVYLWMSVSPPGKIVAIDPETGAVVKSFPNPADEPGGLAWDGENLWVVDTSSGVLIEVSLEGKKTGITIKTPCPHPKGLDWDGKSFWTINSATRKETRKRLCEIPKNYDIVKNSMNCKANSSGIAIHEGSFWINQGLSGKIYTVDRTDKDSFKSNQKNYGNPLHRISCMTWHNEKLWAFDSRNSLLIAFSPKTNFM